MFPLCFRVLYCSTSSQYRTAFLNVVSCGRLRGGRRRGRSQYSAGGRAGSIRGGIREPIPRPLDRSLSVGRGVGRSALSVNRSRALSVSGHVLFMKDYAVKQTLNDRVLATHLPMSDCSAIETQNDGGVGVASEIESNVSSHSHRSEKLAFSAPAHRV